MGTEAGEVKERDGVQIGGLFLGVEPPGSGGHAVFHFIECAVSVFMTPLQRHRRGSIRSDRDQFLVRLSILKSKLLTD